MLVVTVISDPLALFLKRFGIGSSGVCKTTNRNGIMRYGKVQWKALLKCSIMSGARVHSPALTGVSLPQLGDNLVQLGLDLPNYYGLAWQSLICGRLWLPSSDQALPCWLNFLAWPQICLVITASSGSHWYFSWSWLLSRSCSAFLFRCCGTVPLSESALSCPLCCDSWLPLSFPSSLPLLLPDIWLQTGENCFLFIFIAEVGNKMFLWKEISIKQPALTCYRTGCTFSAFGSAVGTGWITQEKPFTDINCVVIKHAAL